MYLRAKQSSQMKEGAAYSIELRETFVLSYRAKTATAKYVCCTEGSPEQEEQDPDPSEATE